MVEEVLLDPFLSTALFIVSLVLAVMTIWGVFLPSPRAYDTTQVLVRSTDGSHRGTLTVRVADTIYKQFVGLSKTDALASNEGMLFAHNSEKDRRYAMRNVSVSIDILFIDSTGEITEIVSMESPENLGGQLVYETHKASCQQVIEAPYGWANAHGVTEGDTVVVDDVSE